MRGGENARAALLVRRDHDPAVKQVEVALVEAPLRVECGVLFEFHAPDAVAEHSAKTVPVKARDTDEVLDVQDVREDNSRRLAPAELGKECDVEIGRAHV